MSTITNPLLDLEGEVPFVQPEQGGRFRDALSKLGGRIALRSSVEAMHIPDEEELLPLLREPDEAYQPGGELYQTLRTALVAKDGEAGDERLYDSSLAITEHLVEDGFDSLGVVDQVIKYLQTCHNIDRAKIQVTNQKAPTGRSNAIQSMVATRLTNRMDLVSKRENYFAVMNRMLTLLEHSTNLNARWDHGKLHLLKAQYSQLERSYDLAEKLGKKAEGNPKPEIIEAGQAEISEVFSEVYKQRHYGVKDAYTLAAMGGSWIFRDLKVYAPHESASNTTHRLTRGSKVAMMLIHSPKDIFDDVTARVTQTSYVGDRDTVIGEDFSWAKADSAMNLHTDGELYLDSYGLQPLRPFFEARGAYRQYVGLQTEAIANFYDMTAPAIVVDRINENVRARPDGSQDRDIDPIVDLLLPRIKYIKGSPEHQALLDEARAEEEKNQRSLRVHGVIYHRRVLPKGWKASPEARALADEHNFELAPNETFVKAHERGNSGTKATMHHTKKRNRRK